jgi:hypothetical protein
MEDFDTPMFRTNPRIEDVDTLLAGPGSGTADPGDSLVVSDDVDVIDDADDEGASQHDDDDIDRVSLLREFSALLQEPRAVADG